MPFLAFFVFFILFRLVPYIHSAIPLGYDPGVYLFLFKQYQRIPYLAFTNFPKWMVESFDPGIAVVGKVLSQFFSPEKLLIPLIVASSALLFISAYLLTKKLFGKTAALWSALVFVCSAIQFHFYWYYYLRNISSLAFLLFAFYFLASGSYWAIPFSILVVYFHRQTALILFLCLATGFVLLKRQRRYYLIVLASTIVAASIYYLPTWRLTILPFVQPIFQLFSPGASDITRDGLGGSFYGTLPSFLLMLPYLPFAVYGLIKTRHTRENFPVRAALSAALVFVGLRLFFYRRFIPILDIFVIIFSGIGLLLFTSVLSGMRRKIFLFAYPAILILFISIFVYKTGQPLIADDELQEIAQLSQTEPNSSILVMDYAYTPWVYGWSDRRTIAPGFGENDIYWTESQWQNFRMSGDSNLEKQLLLKIPKPLYIFQGDRGAAIKFSPVGDCFERINWRTYKFTCN